MTAYKPDLGCKNRKMNKHTDIQCGAELTDILQNAFLPFEGGQRAQSAQRERDDVMLFKICSGNGLVEYVAC